MTGGSDDSMHTASYLLSVTYLKSPLLTLVSSLHDTDLDNISLLDLLDAYSTLFLRIRTISSSLLNAAADLPALRPIANFSGHLAQCLQRDIRRAFDDPIASASQHPGHALIPTIDNDAAYGAKELTMISQYAIHITAIIFKLPSLHLLFSQDNMTCLLDDLLVIARSVNLASIDSEKTGAIAMSVFSTLCIPPTVVSSRKDRILAWVSESVGCMSSSTDGTKIIHHLLSTYPSTFLPEMVRFLPEIFARIVASDATQRMDAAIALSGYATAILSVWSSVGNNLKSEVLTKVRDFIVSQLPREMKNSGVETTQLLPYQLMRAIASSSANEHGPRWAVTVVCCLIVLSGHGVFSGSRPCKLVLQTAQYISRRKDKISEELLGCLWKCLIWAFSQIPRDDMTAVKNKQGADEHPLNPRGIPFGIVRQELRGGAGACLVTNLLHARSNRSCRVPSEGLDLEVVWAVSVLKDMVSSPYDHIYRHGVDTLVRMVSAIGTSANITGSPSYMERWTPSDAIVKALFLRHVMVADLATFLSIINDASRFDPMAVRALPEDEIQQIWNELLDVWNVCIRRELQSADYTTLPEPLVQTWQALLLVQTHLTQEHGHLTATQTFTDSVVSTMASLLDWSPSSETTQLPSPSTLVQSRVLSLCLQLWNIVRNVFSDAWLSQAATTLLARVVQHTFEISSEHVKMTWSQFCAALVSASSPALIARLVAEEDGRHHLKLRRSLWTLAARSWTIINPRPSWVDSVDLLVMPLRYWSMSEDEMATWKIVLEHAIARASLTTGSSHVVLDAVIERATGNEGIDKLIEAPKHLLHLLSHLRVKSELKKMSPFLQVVSSILRDLYTETPENITTAMQAMEHMRRIVQETPASAIVAVLSSLADGLSIWIGDDSEYLSEQEYNDFIAPIYCGALDALRNISISLDTLHALAHFLYSAFVRIPHPGHGPIAFYHFWRHIQPSVAHFSGAYPDDIKTALQACHDAFGIDLPDGVSLETDSQVGTQAQGHLALLSSPAISVSPTKGSKRSRAGQNSPMYAEWPLLRSPLATHVNSSPAASTNASRLLTSSRAVSRLPHGTSDIATPSRRNDDPTTARSSDYAPSSPTNALRARKFALGQMSRVSHERAARTPERPLKRRKLSSPLAERRSPGPSSDRQSSRAPSPLKRKAHPASASTGSSHSRWLFYGVEVPSYRDRDSGRRADTAGLSTVTPRGSRVEPKREQLLTPEVPSPTTVARARPPSSDDYDAWEVPICTDDMDLDVDTDSDSDSDINVVPDSQPAHEGEDDDDDSLVPSFMKSSKGKDKGKDKSKDAQPPDPADDTMLLDDIHYAEDKVRPAAPTSTTKAQGKLPQRTSPLRMHTAPASFVHTMPNIHGDHDTHDGATSPLPAPTPPRVPLRRARTTSVRLGELEDVCDALQGDGSQLGVDDIVAATALTHRLGALLSEKLSKKLGGSSKRAGS